MRISDWSSDVCSSDLEVKDSPSTSSGQTVDGIGDSSQRKVEPDIRRRRRLRQPPDRHIGHSRRADLADRVEPHAARRLGRHFAIDQRDACPQLVETHIVEQQVRSEEHTSEIQSLMRNSYAVFCLNKTKKKDN